jgi:hypothetical protein
MTSKSTASSDEPTTRTTAPRKSGPSKAPQASARPHGHANVPVHGLHLDGSDGRDTARVSQPGADGATGASTPPSDGRSPFPAIADYAFLSDCETNALVAPSGAIEWMCAPRPDSPSIFSAILDRGAGSFRVGPYGVNVPVARRYLPGTLVLETTWQTTTGWLVVRDAMVMGPWHNVDERSKTHRRTPTDYDAEHTLLRTIMCVNGTVEVDLVCEPMPD